MSAFTTQNENGIAVITFDLPGEPVNKLTAAVRVEIEALLIRLRDDTSTRAVVLISGKADNFIAGADIDEFTALTSQDAAERLSFEGQETVSRVETSHKPIVAAIHGAAIGGGLGLAVSADFRVTCPEARFAANFTKLGFHPGFGLTATLPELVGKNNAELIFYTSRRVTGEEATRMGLANLCVPQDQVRAEAMKLAAEIAECSPLGLISTRATMRAGLADRVLAATNHELVEQTKLRATEDFKEGVKATAERRVANFKGR